MERDLQTKISALENSEKNYMTWLALAALWR